MSLINKMLKIVGKDGFSIDERIGKKYIYSLCCKYGLMALRGLFFSFGYPLINGSVFVGRKVKVLEKR